LRSVNTKHNKSDLQGLTRGRHVPLALWYLGAWLFTSKIDKSYTGIQKKPVKEVRTRAYRGQFEVLCENLRVHDAPIAALQTAFSATPAQLSKVKPDKELCCRKLHMVKL
jgi:hypothetical protein